MKKVYFLAIFFFLIFITGCNVVQVSTDYDKNTNFTQYRTYSYHEKGLEKLKINELDKKRIINAVDYELSKKGFIKSNENPDLLLNLLASYKTGVDITENYWYNDLLDRDLFLPNISIVSQYATGTIIIDIIDHKSNILIWQGIGSNIIVSNVEIKEEKIPQAINKILRNFPPKN